MRRYIDLCEGWRFRKNEGDEWERVISEVDMRNGEITIC